MRSSDDWPRPRWPLSVSGPHDEWVPPWQRRREFVEAADEFQRKVRFETGLAILRDRCSGVPIAEVWAAYREVETPSAVKCRARRLTAITRAEQASRAARRRPRPYVTRERPQPKRPKRPKRLPPPHPEAQVTPLIDTGTAVVEARIGAPLFPTEATTLTSILEGWCCEWCGSANLKGTRPFVCVECRHRSWRRGMRRFTNYPAKERWLVECRTRWT